MDGSLSDAMLLAASTAKPLPGVFHHFQHVLDTYCYVAIAVALLAENFGIPLPGEAILIAAALDAGAGGLNIWVVGLVAILASVAGSCVGYWIGTSGGHRLAGLHRGDDRARLPPVPRCLEHGPDAGLAERRQQSPLAGIRHRDGDRHRRRQHLDSAGRHGRYRALMTPLIVAHLTLHRAAVAPQEEE